MKIVLNVSRLLTGLGLGRNDTDGKTMNKLKLISPIPPSVNHYIAYRTIIRNGKPLAMSYKTPKAKKYQKDFIKYVTNEVKKQNYNMIPNKTQHFYIDAVFYFERIDCDPNNYWKCLLDAITDTQLIWIDDNVTCERVNRIYYDSENPRIELEIYPVNYIGVFDNATQLKNFEQRCIECVRYKRNCSIFKKAIEGRIQSDICNGICSQYKKII